jgi:hypothetical protein
MTNFSFTGFFIVIVLAFARQAFRCPLGLLTGPTKHFTPVPSRVSDILLLFGVENFLIAQTGKCVLCFALAVVPIQLSAFPQSCS